MGVRVVIPNMSKTFGALHYAGEGLSLIHI